MQSLVRLPGVLPMRDASSLPVPLHGTAARPRTRRGRVTIALASAATPAPEPA